MKAAIPYCVCCLSSDHHLTKDHILEICFGGSDSIGNLQPLCRKCNSSRRTGMRDLRPHPLPIEWQWTDKPPGWVFSNYREKINDIITCGMYISLI